MKLTKQLNNFKSKHCEGLTDSEIDQFLLTHYSMISRKELNKGLGYGYTVMVKDGETVTYRIDIYHAIKNALRKVK